jgi:hypothetical protein
MWGSMEKLFGSCGVWGDYECPILDEKVCEPEESIC